LSRSFRNGAIIVEKTWADKSAQEEFVLNILKNKKNGHYVELGAYHSKNGSNTYRLENEFDWTGVSFEIVPELHKEVSENRKNPCILGDATKFNYIKYFEENNFPNQIDYLQVDIDAGYDGYGRPVGSAYTSLHGLIAVPLNQYRFSVITFEHDANMYWKNTSIRDMQREILDSLGYSLVVREIHEDWWVDPNVVSMGQYRKFFKWDTL
jgi:hypothetical protein